MTEYLRRKTKPYSEWSDQLYEDCLPQLVETINTFDLRGFTVQVAREDFDSRLRDR